MLYLMLAVNIIGFFITLYEAINFTISLNPIGILLTIVALDQIYDTQRLLNKNSLKSKTIETLTTILDIFTLIISQILITQFMAFYYATRSPSYAYIIAILVIYSLITVYEITTDISTIILKKKSITMKVDY